MVTGRTAAVIGWPIRHSRSPLIHRHWLSAYGIPGDYVAVAVEPERLDAFLGGYAELGYVGGNVTVPHKEAALAAVAVADPVAAALGAVNTLWLEDGRLVGGNTDPAGFLANLDAAAPSWSRPGEVAVVLGAGGAARAVIWALVQRGFDPVVVANRTLERAEAVARRFGSTVRAVPFEKLGDWLPRAKLLVNATSAGMAGHGELDIDMAALPDDAVVTDLVYAPLVTDFLAKARSRKLVTVDGLGMLLHQAAPGFERWFGIRPEVTPALRDLVVADLGAG